jgi:type II secretory pathway component GspD/PulD (secretin)
MPRLLLLPLLSLALAGLPACTATAHTEPGAEDTVLEVVALQYAVAGEVAASMSDLLHASGAPAVTFAADQRTNSVVIRGPSKEVAEAREAIEKLDRRVQ